MKAVIASKFVALPSRLLWQFKRGIVYLIYMTNNETPKRFCTVQLSDGIDQTG